MLVASVTRSTTKKTQKPDAQQREHDRLMRKLRIEETPVGKGVFAQRAMGADIVVGEIFGEVLDEHPADPNYCMELQSGRLLEPGAPLRFINHSCEPNCELFYWVDEESDAPIEDRLWLQTIRKIAAGEEMTIDYCWPADAAIRCRCGSASCRGWIVDPDEFDQLPTSQPKAWKAYVAETKGDAPKASRKRASSKTRK
jgi:hypothetical protein